MTSLHLLVRDGAPLPSPLPIPRDEAGARALAELYAFPRERLWVRAMMNTSVDGSITGADGTCSPLRNPTDSFAFGVLRALADVVLVGAQTVRVEDYRRPQGRRSLLDPSLRPGGASRPTLAIVTRTGDLPKSVEPDWPTYLLSPTDAVETVARTSGFPREHVLAVDTPARMIAALAERGHRGIQCEGGPSLLTALAATGVLDELCLSVTSTVVGGTGPRVMSGPQLEDAWRLESLVLNEGAQLTRYRRISRAPGHTGCAPAG